MTPNPTNSRLPETEQLLRKAHDAIIAMFQLTRVTDHRDTPNTVGVKIFQSQRQAFEMTEMLADVWADLIERGTSSALEWKHLIASAEAHIQAELLNLPPDTTQDPAQNKKQTLRDILSPPPSESLLTSPEYSDALNKLYRAWVDHQKKDQIYRAYLSGAWLETFKVMTAHIEIMVDQGIRFEHPRDLVDTWINTADEIFGRHLNHADFLKLQAEVFNSGHHFRKLRRRITEDLLIAHDLPTRTELEEAYRVIHELQKEVRELKQRIEILEGDS